MPRIHGDQEAAAAAAAAVRYAAPRPPPGVLCKSYRCHSVACLGRPGLELGDKIIMPQSAFKEAHRLRLRLPLLFKVVGKRRKGIAGPPPCQFCGVLEFSASQDQVFLPYWMMQNLLLSEGGQVELRSILHPPAGSFVRFRPHDGTFLGVAAQQGPKALMECALRRYSVLSEGVTILVQHENENFYLDVVELRTSAPPPDGHADGADYTSEWCIDGGGGEGRHDDDGGDKDHDLTGGKRVPLVSLLGDLDLEVEFCAPSPQNAREDLAGLRDVEEPSTSTSALAATASGHAARLSAATPAVSSTQDRTAGAESLRQTESAVCLPVLATAKSCASAGVEPGRKAGWLGTPSRDIFSRLSKCRAFSGSGVALGGARPVDKRRKHPHDNPHRIVTRGDLDGLGHRTEETTTKCAAETADANFTSVTDATDDSRGAIPASCGELPKGTDAKNASFSGSGTGKIGEGDARGRGRGKGLLGGAAAAGAVAKPVVNAEPVGKNDPGAVGEDGTIQCEFCGKSVPVANRCIHELRCSAMRRTSVEVGAQGSEGVRRVPNTDTCALNQGQEPVRNVDRPLSLKKPDTVAGGGASPPSVAEKREHPSSAVSASLVDTSSSRQAKLLERSGRSQPNSSGNSGGDARGRQSIRRTGADQDDDEVSSDDKRRDPHVINPGLSPSGRGGGAIAETCSTLAREAFGHHTEHEKGAGRTDDPSTQPRRDDPQAPPPPPCGFCGLSFRTAGAAIAHETLCGTRTERCERCCGHVSRRDGESHRKPGGGCDAAIAAAIAREDQANAIAMAWAADAADECGVGASGGGVGIREHRGINGGIRSSMGKFDSLLAEAITSSKAASATLKAARVRNDGLEMSLSGKALQPRGGNGDGTRESAFTKEPSPAGRLTCRNKDSDDNTGSGTSGRHVDVSTCVGNGKNKESRGGDARATCSVRQSSMLAAPAVSSFNCLREQSRAGCKRSVETEPTKAAAAAGGIASSVQHSTSANEHQRGLSSDLDGTPPSGDHDTLEASSLQEESLLMASNRDGTPIAPPCGADARAIEEGLVSKTADQLLRMDGVSAGRAVTSEGTPAGDMGRGSPTTDGGDTDGEESKGVEGASGAARGQWACSRCTLENSSRVGVCGACGSGRVDNGIEGYHAGLESAYCAPIFAVEKAAAAPAAAVNSAEKVLAVRNRSGGSAEVSENKASTAATLLAAAAGVAPRGSQALLPGQTSRRAVALHGIVATPPDQAPGDVHRRMERRNSSLLLDPGFSPLAASLTTSLDASPGSQPRRASISGSSTIDDMNEYGGTEVLSGTQFRLEPTRTVAGSLTRLPASDQEHPLPQSPAVRTPVLLPIPSRKNTVPGGALRGNVASGLDFAHAASPTVPAGPTGRIGLEVHPVPSDDFGLARHHADRFEHPRKPQAGQARKARAGDRLLLPRGGISTQHDRGGSTMVWMRPRRLGGVARPPRSRYPRSSPPSGDASVPAELEPAAHSVSVAYPRTVPELATTTDLFSRPLTLRSSTGLKASRRDGTGHQESRRQHKQQHQHQQQQQQQQQQQESVTRPAPRPSLRAKFGGDFRGDSGGGGIGGSGIGGGGSGGSEAVVPNVGTLTGAPACDLSLSILGRRQGACGHSMDPLSRARASVSMGNVQVKAAKSRVPHEPARGVIGGSRARYDRGERGRGIGVAPSKLRRRVSDTWVLEPLHPD